jgi:predicted TPR repeat methyltransferase
MDRNFEQARTLFLAGVQHYRAGRLLQAEQNFAGALSLMPGRPSVLTNLGAVRLKLGRLEEAAELLGEALAQEPDNAEALGHYGTALAEMGRTGEALARFERALAIDPAPPALWMFRGHALKELGRAPEAAASYREALARGGERELLGYYLAGLEGATAPLRPPRPYVEALFDNYAATFDTHLVQTLGYDAPAVLVPPLVQGGQRFAHALDLGCGTGLVGRLLRPHAQRLTGVDLSANMLEVAARLGAYDQLQQADVLEFLAAAQDSYDCVVAADVFVYVGALDEVFRLLSQRMPAAGVFSFTVEESSAGEAVLRPSLRYAHSEAGIRRLAQAHGFTITALDKRPVREDQQQPIPGLFFWMAKS